MQTSEIFGSGVRERGSVWSRDKGVIRIKLTTEDMSVSKVIKGKGSFMSVIIVNVMFIPNKGIESIM